MDAKNIYQSIAPVFDPEGFKLYFIAQKITGFDLYGQFPYEDACGMFELMDGHQLMRYLLADRFQTVRWEIVPGTTYERAILQPVDTTTPAYQKFQNELYKTLLQSNPQWMRYAKARKKSQRKEQAAR